MERNMALLPFDSWFSVVHDSLISSGCSYKVAFQTTPSLVNDVNKLPASGCPFAFSVSFHPEKHHLWDRATAPVISRWFVSPHALRGKPWDRIVSLCSSWLWWLILGSTWLGLESAWRQVSESSSEGFRLSEVGSQNLSATAQLKGRGRRLCFCLLYFTLTGNFLLLAVSFCWPHFCFQCGLKKQQPSRDPPDSRCQVEVTEAPSSTDGEAMESADSQMWNCHWITQIISCKPIENKIPLIRHSRYLFWFARQPWQTHRPKHFLCWSWVQALPEAFNARCWSLFSLGSCSYSCLLHEPTFPLQTLPGCTIRLFSISFYCLLVINCES